MPSSGVRRPCTLMIAVNVVLQVRTQWCVLAEIFLGRKLHYCKLYSTMVRLDRKLSEEDYNMITKFYVDDRRECCSTSKYTMMRFYRNLSGENYYYCWWFLYQWCVFAGTYPEIFYKYTMVWQLSGENYNMIAVNVNQKMRAQWCGLTGFCLPGRITIIADDYHCVVQQVHNPAFL